MLAKVIVVFVVYFFTFVLNGALGLHLKAGIINGDTVGALAHEGNGLMFYQPDGEYPYMASMEVSGFNLCGAVIVHKSAVLTAAHCASYDKASVMTVRAGTVYGQGERKSGQVRKVSHLWFHPYFVDINYEFDIGILYLEKPFDFDYYVNKIRMEFNEDYVGETFTALGFGWTLQTGGGYPNLKKADLTVIGTKACQKRAKKTHYIPSEMICAIGDDQGLCRGDSGGPFVKHYPGHPEKDYLVGIVSSGPKLNTCDPKSYFMFSTVHFNKDSLNEEFEKNKLSI